MREIEQQPAGKVMKSKMRVGKKSILAGFVAIALLTLLLVQPVQGWDYGVEYVDDVEEIIGDWYDNENEALEGSIFFGWDIHIEFEIWYVVQNADVYKLRIDYDDWDEMYPEALRVDYRWGDTGGWTFVTYCSNAAKDYQYTIADATSSTLHVRFTAEFDFGDFQRDLWTFGREPELWIYMN